MTNTSAAGAISAQQSARDGYTPRQILTILSGLMLGMFLAALDQTVVSTAIRTISDDLKGFDLQAWATTAFLITSTIATDYSRRSLGSYDPAGVLCFENLLAISDKVPKKSAFVNPVHTLKMVLWMLY